MNVRHLVNDVGVVLFMWTVGMVVFVVGFAIGHWPAILIIFLAVRLWYIGV